MEENLIAKMVGGDESDLAELQKFVLSYYYGWNSLVSLGLRVQLKSNLYGVSCIIYDEGKYYINFEKL